MVYQTTLRLQAHLVTCSRAACSQTGIITALGSDLQQRMMSNGRFITSLPAADGSRIPVKVVEGDLSHAEAWDRDVQGPWIAKTDRIDAAWKWRRHYLRSVLLEMAVGRRLAFLRLVTPAADGSAFTIGQVLLADGYPYPPDRTLPCVFLWYLAGAPAEAAKAASVKSYKAVLAALVDAAIQFSYIRGYEGRLCLHASPAGSAAQRSDLWNRYKQVGLKPWNGGLFAGWFRRNDGRYFYADAALAATLSKSLDAYR